MILKADFVIANFKNKCAQDIYDGINSSHARKLPKYLHTNAREKLDMLAAAKEIHDLKYPPGNKLEKLMGNLKAKYSLRINDQWRIVFLWQDGQAFDVEIIDYH